MNQKKTTQKKTVQKKITMADIAELAGVTKSTVSRYFNGGYVKEDTRERISRVIREYHYEPNSFARLNAKASRVIGVVVPTLNSKVTSRVITSIDRYLRREGYETLIKNSDHDATLELHNLQRLIGLNVDGILLSATTITEEHREIIESSPIPIVVLAQDYEQGLSVMDDDYRAGRYMGEYVGRVCRRAAYLGVYESDAAVGRMRKQGVLDGLKACGIDDPVVLLGDYSFESGQQLTRRLLEQTLVGQTTAEQRTAGQSSMKQTAVDGIICATDRLAYGAYRVLEQAGLRIPEDVSVAGFGGYDESMLLKPELTTLKFDSYALGHLGAETLLKVIRQEPVPKRQMVDYTLIEGGSVRREESTGMV